MTAPGRHVARSQSPLQALHGIGDLGSGLLTGLVTSLMVAGALTFLVGALAIVSLHVSTQTVLTGSMRGTFDPGALVFTRPIPVSAVRPGDVIVFTPPGHTTPFTHRVVTVSGSPDHRVVTTKGDANRAPDAWKAQLKGSTVPRVIGHVPYVGRVYVALQGRSLRLVLIALLGTVVAVSGTRLLLGSSRQRHQQHLPHPA